MARSAGHNTSRAHGEGVNDRDEAALGVQLGLELLDALVVVVQPIVDVAQQRPREDFFPKNMARDSCVPIRALRPWRSPRRDGVESSAGGGLHACARHTTGACRCAPEKSRAYRLLTSSRFAIAWSIASGFIKSRTCLQGVPRRRTGAETY